MSGKSASAANMPSGGDDLDIGSKQAKQGVDG